MISMKSITTMQTNENIFAPLCGFVVNGKQVYIFENKDYLIFCDEQKNSINLLMLSNLLDVMGLVYDDEGFHFIDYFKNETLLNYVWFINKQGKIISKERIVKGYCRLSSECVVVNSTMRSLQECECNNVSENCVVVNRWSKPNKTTNECEIPQYIIKGSEIIGRYFCSIDANHHIIEDDNAGCCKFFKLIDNYGQIILTAEDVVVKSNKDSCNLIYSHCDYNNENPYSLNIWTTKSKEIEKIPWINSQFDIEGKNGYIVIYSENKRHSDSASNELCLCVIKPDDEFIFSEVLYDCHFQSILKEGILLQRFGTDVQSEYNEYDDENYYSEVTHNCGLYLLSFQCKYIGDSFYIGEKLGSAHPSGRYM